MRNLLLLFLFIYSTHAIAARQYTSLDGREWCCTTVGPGLAATGCTQNFTVTNFGSDLCNKAAIIKHHYLDFTDGSVKPSLIKKNTMIIQTPK